MAIPPPMSSAASSMIRRSVTQALIPRRLDPFGVGWKTHLVVLALSWIIWWALDQRVAATAMVADRTTLGVVLDPNDRALNERFSVLKQPVLRPSLILRGPRKELSDMQDILASRKSAVEYDFVISAAELAGLAPDSEHQIQLERPVSRFALQTRLSTPFEGSLALSDTGEMVRFVLEERVTLPAEFNDAAIKVPSTHDRVVTVNSPVRVRAAWSLLNGLISPDFATVRLELAPLDLSSLPAEALGGTITRNVGIQALGGAEFLDDLGRAVFTVNISVALSPKVSFEEATCTVPISYLLPAWMVERHVTISLSIDAREFEVRLLVDPARREHCNRTVIRAVLDLRDVASDDLVNLSSSSANRRKAHVTRYVGLEIDRAELAFFRIPEDMAATFERFYPAIVTFEWNES